MMRHYQNRVARKASRKAILEGASTGVIAWVRTFNRFQLCLALGSLATSVLLLFIGTYVYFDASIISAAAPENGTGGGNQRTALYDTILALYGIDETAFSMLYPDNDIVQRLPGTSNSGNNNFKLINYQIGISMMFVGAASILIEVGLICAVLFEHFKLSILYTVLMAASLAHGLLGKTGQLYAFSLTVQIALFLSFAVFSLGIKVKRRAANRILNDQGQGIELITGGGGRKRGSTTESTGRLQADKV